MGDADREPLARRAGRSIGTASVTAGRVGAAAANGAGRVVHRLSRASGAGRTGLSNLIELTAASSVGDAFVAVSLAGTLFFSASVDQARGRIALALLITMAPFAILAPFLGPMLDRVQQGRRYILMGTLLARGLLCWGMAGAVQHDDTLTLLPAAFGVLVLQKAYGVTRAAVTPRLLPAEITLVSANARSALGSLVATSLGAVAAAGVSVVFGGGAGGAAWVLRIGTAVYLAAAILGLRLPNGVDAPAEVPDAPPQPGDTWPETAVPGQEQARPEAAKPAAGGRTAAPTGLRRLFTMPTVGPIVREAMEANATLRAFSGFMIFFLAFILRTEHFAGTSDKLALGEMIGAAAIGGFIGTGIGAALRSRAPQMIVFATLILATVTCAFCAVYYGLWAALIVAAAAALCQALVKLALDSILQDEIGEEVRSSTFAVSETLHQLSWVAGGLLGLAMSLTNSGVAGLAVAGSGLAVALAALLLTRRRRILNAPGPAPEMSRPVSSP
jgi:MFS family permease